MKKLIVCCLLAGLFSGCASQEKLTSQCSDRPEVKEPGKIISVGFANQARIRELGEINPRKNVS